MAAFLLLKPLFQRLHQLVEPAKRFDLFHLGGGQMLLGHLLQPVGGNIHSLQHILELDILKTLEGFGESAVELVDIALVLHHGSAGEVVEPLHIIGDETGRHPLQKREILTQADRDAAFSQVFKEGQKHRITTPRGG